jgi:hypothetical protein
MVPVSALAATRRLSPIGSKLTIGLLSALGTVVACGGGGDGAGSSRDGGSTGAGSSSGGDAGAGSSSGGSGSSGAGSSSGGGGSSGAGSGGGDGGASSSALPFGGVFRHGMNSGHVNPNFTDNDDGLLGTLAGADSNRIKLPEYFLDQWGVAVRTDAAKSYVTNGMSNLVCFLIGPSASHSTAPSGADDATLEQYIPSDLYQSIFAADGSVNPGNSWAKYVEETVTTYKPWVRIWEVWNEPDWTSDYATTMKWATAAPTKADLPRYNGDIYDYVRMLRITTAVAKKVDPTALVALGGIGYPTFLSAILRYTDNPADGSATTDYPSKGDAYFDVLNFHYYPLYTPGNSDAAVDGLFNLRDQLQAELTKVNVGGKSWNATETGAPRYALGTYPGGDDYAKNYLLKAMLEAHRQGMIGLDWFLLADGAKIGASTDSYSYMGLYLNTTGLTTTTAAVKTDPGVAYTTLGKILKGAVADAAATAALSLPSTVGGGAFVAADGRHVVALWARGSNESATATYALATTGPVTVYAWDYASTGATQSLAAPPPGVGHATVTLTSTPQLFVRP